MTENDLPAEAIADPRTFTDEGALHGLLARLRRTDPLPFIEADDYAPFWLVTRHADTANPTASSPSAPGLMCASASTSLASSPSSANCWRGSSTSNLRGSRAWSRAASSAG